MPIITESDEAREERRRNTEAFNASIKALSFRDLLREYHGMFTKEWRDWNNNPPVDISDENLRDDNKGQKVNSLYDAHLQGVVAKRANFSSLKLEYLHGEGADFTAADFSISILTSASLRGADLTDANLNWADIQSVDVHNAILINAKGIYGYGCAKNAASVLNAGSAKYGYKYDYLKWSFLRSFGSLPLFGISYFGIFSIWLIAVCVALGNKYLAVLQHSSEGGVHKVAEFIERLPSTGKLDVVIDWLIGVIIRLPHLYNPPQLGMTLTALIFLAVAATLYRLYCPTEIQENSEARWIAELKQPLISYRAMDYCKFWRRQITGVCYLIGAPWVLWLFANRVFDAFKLIYFP
jgi:hypothetical protein